MLFVVFNLYAAAELAVAGIAATIISVLIAGDGVGRPTTLPYTFAGLLLVIDLILRVYSWRRRLTSASAATLLTRAGYVVPPSQPGIEIAKSLLGPKSGGQMFLIPVWLLGMAIAVLTFLWHGWFASNDPTFDHPPHAYERYVQ